MRTLALAIPLFSLALPPALAAQETQSGNGESFWKHKTLTGDWGGTRTRWSDRGFEPGLEYVGEFLANVHGGVREGELYQHVVNASLGFDLEKLAGWKGGRLYASSLWLWGTQPDDIAGLTGSTYSDPSNISGYDTLRLYELWLEQELFGGKLSVRGGQIALDEEFICSDYGCLFLSGTHGWPVYLSATLPNGGPAYPVAGTGVRLDFRPSETLAVLAAVTTGDVGDQATASRHGTRFGFNADEGVLAIAELAWHFNLKAGGRNLPGTCRIGGWYHSGSFNDQRYDRDGISLEDDGTLSGHPSDGTPDSHDGDGGIYLDVDQMVWREKDGTDEGLGAYLRLAPWLPGDRNPLDFYAAGGLNYKGLIPGRSRDICGVALSYVRISDRLRGAQSDANRVAAAQGTPNTLSPGPVPDYEMDLEITYQINLAPWWSLQPDFQYIFHPGGSSAIPDAVVLGIRTALVF